MNNNFKISEVFENASKLIESYHYLLQPICKEYDLPPLAVDILLFIANNPINATAKDICRFRGLKTGIVSVHIERLVKEGYLNRLDDPNDRRKVLLELTDVSKPIIEKGKNIQSAFSECLVKGISPNDVAALHRALDTFRRNIDDIWNNKQLYEEVNK